MMLDATWDSAIGKAAQLASGTYICFAQLPRTGGERVLFAQEDDWQVEDDAVPAPAAAEGMTECLTQGDLAQIVENVLEQDPKADPGLLREAVIYYWKNDAFLTVAAE